MVTTGEEGLQVHDDGTYTYSQGYSNASLVIDMNSTNSCSDFPAYPGGKDSEARLAAGAVLDGSPLVCGGNGDGRSCYMHNKTSYNWEKLTDELSGWRYDFAMAMYNGVMWAVGGYAATTTSDYIYPNGSIVKGPNYELYWAPHDWTHGISYGQCMLSLPNGKMMFIGGHKGIFLVTLILSILPRSLLFSRIMSIM